MKKVSPNKLAALVPAAIAIGCNAHPLKEVEYQHGGIELEDAGHESGDFGHEDEGEDFGDADAGHDGDDDALPPADDGLDDGEDDGGEPLCTTTTIDVAANPPEVMLVLVTELPLAESRC